MILSLQRQIHQRALQSGKRAYTGPLTNELPIRTAGGNPNGCGVTRYGLIITAGIGTAGYRRVARVPNGPRGTGHVTGYATRRDCTPTPGAYKGTGGRGQFSDEHTSGPAADAKLTPGPGLEAPYCPARTVGRRMAIRMSPPISSGVACADDLRLIGVRGLAGGSRESAGGGIRLGRADTRHARAALESRPIGWHSSPGRGPQVLRFR